MINFVIYEDNKKIIDHYTEVIHRFMGNNDNKYKIRIFQSYTPILKEYISNNTGKNIYILDLEVPEKSGLDLAREIRKNGKCSDQIIIATAHNELKDNAYRSKILMVDFLSKYDNLEGNLMECLNAAFEYMSKHESFKFKQDGEIIQIPYCDILFIEKDKKDNEIYIITKNDRIRIKSNMSTIEKMLISSPQFFKTHRSCIVNLNNIIRVDMVNQVIMFNNKKSTMNLARNKKREFEKRILEVKR